MDTDRPVDDCDSTEMAVEEFFDAGTLDAGTLDANSALGDAPAIPVPPPVSVPVPPPPPIPPPIPSPIPSPPPVAVGVSPPVIQPSVPPVASVSSLSPAIEGDGAEPASVKVLGNRAGPLLDRSLEEEKLRDCFSFASSALIHSAALVLLALFSNVIQERETVIWLEVPASPVVDTPLTEAVQVTPPAAPSAHASFADATGQVTSADHEALESLTNLGSDEPMLEEVEAIAGGSGTGNSGTKGGAGVLAPANDLWNVVGVRRQQSMNLGNDLPASANDTPFAMARAATLGQPQWGESPAERAVYRFILYDIGKLQGLEAAEAQLAFSSLPNDALPELIKGLNASAYLQASCPVVVLSSRVQSSLASMNSREAYAYALNNIGKGVPANANYASHLAGLRQRLAAESGMAGRSGGQGQPLRPQRAQRVAALQHAGSKRLSEALESGDVDERWAAVRVVAARGLRLTDELVPLLADDDVSVREETHAALVRLARGVDLGPENPHDEAQVDESIDLWRRWWTQNKGRQGVSEYTSQQDEAMRMRRASNRLSLAEKLIAGGHRKEAVKYLEEVQRDYPGTETATRAESLAREIGE